MRQSLFSRSNEPEKEELVDSRRLSELVDLINKKEWSLFTKACQDLEKRFSQWSIDKYLLSKTTPVRFDRERLDGNLIHQLLANNPSKDALEAFLRLGPDLNALATRSVTGFRRTKLPLEIAIQLKHVPAIRLLLENGADPNLPILDHSSLLKLTCIRYAQGQNLPDHVSQLMQKHGAKFCRNDFTSTMLSQDYHIDLRGLKVEGEISGWNLSGANLIETDFSEVIGITGCFFQKAVYSADTRFPEGVHPESLQMKRAHFDRNSSKWSVDSINLPDSVNSRLKVRMSAKDIQAFAIKSDSDEKFHQSRAALKLAYEVSRSFRDVDFVDPAGLIALMPQIQAQHSAHLLQSYLRNIEHQLDEYYKAGTKRYERKAAGVHPMEPEMMAGLGMVDFNNIEAVNAFTRALTAQTQWIHLGNLFRHPITSARALTWGELGRLALSFKKWKFDAMSSKTLVGGKFERVPSVFEEFGFETIKRLSDTDYSIKEKHILPGLGTGASLSQERIFWLADMPFQPSPFTDLKKFSSRAYIEVRHAYIMVSVPGLGTLIVRNSSRDFGRDRLPFTVAYSTQDVGRQHFREALKKFDHTTYRKYFVSLFNRDLSLIRNPAPNKINLLVGHFLHFERCFDQWKYDTNPDTAFKRSVLGYHELIGGYHSEGFRHVLKTARALYENQDPENPLALVFYAKGKVPYFAEQFESQIPQIIAGQTYGNTPLDYLPLNEERLNLLEGYVNNELTIDDDERIANSGLRAFLTTGFRSHGCLSLTNIWKNELW